MAKICHKRSPFQDYAGSRFYLLHSTSREDVFYYSALGERLLLRQVLVRHFKKLGYQMVVFIHGSSFTTYDSESELALQKLIGDLPQAGQQLPTDPAAQPAAPASLPANSAFRQAGASAQPASPGPAPAPPTPTPAETAAGGRILYGTEPAGEGKRLGEGLREMAFLYVNKIMRCSEVRSVIIIQGGKQFFSNLPAQFCSAISSWKELPPESNPNICLFLLENFESGQIRQFFEHKDLGDIYNLLSRNIRLIDTPQMDEVGNMLLYLRKEGETLCPRYKLYHWSDYKQLRELLLDYLCGAGGSKLSQIQNDLLNKYVLPQQPLTPAALMQDYGLRQAENSLEKLARPGWENVHHEVEKLVGGFKDLIRREEKKQAEAGWLQGDQPAEERYLAERLGSEIWRIFGNLGPESQVFSLEAARQRGLLDQFRLGVVLKGNPGTGKSTVARLIGRALYEAGLLPSGAFRSVGAADLVSPAVGGTPERTQDVFTSALGGTLLIDEAYALAKGGNGLSNSADHAQEALDTLTQLMEEHIGEICVILAGYTKDMEQLLSADTNRGLKSRFPIEITIEDYPPDLLKSITLAKVKQLEHDFDPIMAGKLDAFFYNWYAARDPEVFGNARAAEELAVSWCRACDARQYRLGRSDKIITLDDPSPTEAGHFTAYSPELLYQIAWEQLKAGKYQFEPSLTKVRMISYLETWQQRLGQQRQEGGQELPEPEAVRLLAGKWLTMSQKRNFGAPSDDRLVTLADVNAAEPELNDTGDRFQRCVEQVNSLTGLAEVKQVINEMNDERKYAYLTGEAMPTARHFLFTGNPGTGKSTVAAYFAQLLCAMGAVGSDKYIQCNGNDLKGQYVGQTGPKVKEMLQSAKGGVLFIDEAHGLAGDGLNQQDSFAQDAMRELLAIIDDEEYRKDTSIIMAGYADKMARFRGVDPGFFGRFRVVNFANYNEDELMEIFTRFLKKAGVNGVYQLTPEAEARLRDFFRFRLAHDRDFANGRTARQTMYRTLTKHKVRAVRDQLGPEEIYTITSDDIPQNEEAL